MAVTVLKIVNKTGTGKRSGKPYDFYVATVVDEDANVFDLTVADELVKEAVEAEKDLSKVRNEPMEVDIEFKPKGFDIAGTIVAWQ